MQVQDDRIQHPVKSSKICQPMKIKILRKLEGANFGFRKQNLSKSIRKQNPYLELKSVFVFGVTPQICYCYCILSRLLPAVIIENHRIPKMSFPALRAW